jgi:coenzyme F420 hydrogenase subunit delta
MWHKKEVLLIGCGNVLFGDDGFGPAVIDYILKNFKLPEKVCAIDAGTGVREILFDVLLSERKPSRIIIIDAIDAGRSAGEIFELEPEELPVKKADGFSLHQLPSSNLLRELKNSCRIDVRLIASQPLKIPELVEPGLSAPLEEAVKKAGRLIFENYLKENTYAGS